MYRSFFAQEYCLCSRSLSDTKRPLLLLRLLITENGPIIIVEDIRTLDTLRAFTMCQELMLPRAAYN